ncbi:MAG: hypothetical protein JNK58_01415 [Phycisphaerae bacterium]|nr:hypothetical protein [Phycisphaerae bacterium]
MKRSHRVRVKSLIVGLVCGSGAICGGCNTEHLGVPGPGAVGGVLVSYGTSAIPHGPRVTFVNDSAMTISIRYWSGRRDTTAPRGVADLRTDEEMSLRALPGEFFITQAGRSWWPTSMSDGVVYARIEVEALDGLKRGPIWLELEQPQPFTFSATGDSPESLEFKRFGGGAIVPLARDRWIDGNNGPFPVYDDVASR